MDLDALQLTLKQRLIEIIRPWLLFSLYLIAASLHFWWLAVPLAFATCLAAFVQIHDTIHSSLGLSKREHQFLLTLSGLLLLKSGHALKVTHFRHHGHCLGENDPEGKPAQWTLLRVLLQGPFHALFLRVEALRIAPRTKRIQLLEILATLGILCVAVLLYLRFGTAVGIVYWVVAAILSAGMPLWAAYLPHRLAPKNPLLLWTSRLSRFWTPILASLAFHHLHHDHPKIPTALLPKAAQILKQSHAHLHSPPTKRQKAS